MGAVKLKDSDPSVSALARNSANLQTQNNANINPSPYAGNLRTSFNAYDLTPQTDQDVIEVQRRTNQNADAAAGKDKGVSYNANMAIIADRMARINLKNQLSSSINNNSAMENEAIEGIKDSAQRGADAGVKKTRQNYNSRGLLYSGMREGGESGVKSAAAAGLAGDISSTKSEYRNMLDQQKQAYAQVGMAQQAAQLELANQAFETATKNSVARAQAYQQLAGGLGQAAGYYYGSKGNSSAATPTETAKPNPSNSWSGNAYTQDPNRGYA